MLQAQIRGDKTIKGEFRFGVIATGHFLEQWQMSSVQKLVAEGSSLEVVLSCDGCHQRSASSGRIQRKVRQKRPVELSTIFPQTPIIDVHASHASPSDDGIVEFNSGDVRKIVSLSLDFILNFSKETPQGEILKAARHGIWTFRHGSIGPSGKECFWELYDDEAVSSAALEKIEQHPNPPAILWTGYFRTIRSSYARNLDQVLAGTTAWPAKTVTLIQAGNAEWDLQGPRTPPTPHRPPNRTKIVFLFLKTTKRRIEAAFRIVFRYTTWNVGVVKSPIQEFLKADFNPKVEWLPQPRNGHIQADPFGKATGNGGLDILYERLDYLHRKGSICAVGFTGGSPTPRPRVAMEEPVHMSYPYIFEHEGQTYCIPETNQAKEVAVYQSVKFPSDWKRTDHRFLSGIRAIDTTVFQHGGLWWLMCTDRDGGGDNNLYAWYATDIWGPWRPHALNPVKTDVRSARPGGTPFESSGQLYRPAQDCSRTGGGQIIINRIERLTPNQFREVPVATVGPFRDSVYKDGMHTLSAAGSYTLVDGKRFKFVPSGLLSNIVRGIGRTRRRKMLTETLRNQ